MVLRRVSFVRTSMYHYRRYLSERLEDDPCLLFRLPPEHVAQVYLGGCSRFDEFFQDALKAQLERVSIPLLP